MLDPAPRVILDNRLGRISVGEQRRMPLSLAISMSIRWSDSPGRSARRLGSSACARDLRRRVLELEQMKLRKTANWPPFQGEIALVTGAASGIGKACVDSLLKRGACVVGLDLNPVSLRCTNGPNSWDWSVT